MTAKEYLESQLRDEWAEPASVQTRKGLAAYAIRMHKGVEGYSISDAENLMRSCGCGKEFIETCIGFLSNSNEFMTMAELITVELDD